MRPEHQRPHFDLVPAARAEFADCFRRAFAEIARLTFHDAKTVAEAVLTEVFAAREKYFQTMKGATNITEAQVQEAIDGEAARQALFRDSLRALADRVKAAGFSFDTRDGGGAAGWDFAWTIGRTVRMDRWTIPAFPLVPAVSRGGDPSQPPDELFYADPGCLLFQPRAVGAARAPRPGDFPVFGPVADVTKEFPGAKKAVKRNNMLLVRASVRPPRKDLEDARVRTGVVAVVVEESSGEARIHTGGEMLPLQIEQDLF